MTRIDLTPEESFTEDLNDIFKSIEEIKTLQLIGGDSVKRYFVTNNVLWDILSFTVPAGVYTYVWNVEVTVDHPEQHPYVFFRVYNSWSPVGASQALTVTPDPAYPAAEGRKMQVSFYNISGEATSLNLRFTFNSGDTGTISYTRIL